MICLRKLNRSRQICARGFPFKRTMIVTPSILVRVLGGGLIIGIINVERLQEITTLSIASQ